MVKPETILQDRIRIAIGTVPGVIVYRNNTGVATHCTCWRECSTPQPCPHCGEMLPPRGDLRRVRYGLAVGSSDLICCVNGRFVAGEVKTPAGRLTPEQRRFRDAVRDAGGVAETWRSVQDALVTIHATKGEHDG